jgi:hopanoid biosynthesis associated protein HpnK
MDAIQAVFNADDLGSSPTINAAILRAHREGVLTSASWMAGGAAAAEAVALARDTPTLAIGLHLVVAGGPAVLPPSDIPHLVDGNGRFPRDTPALGVKYAFSPAARRELGREIAAQFACFAATGLPLSHVDGHLHMHLHPAVLSLVLPLAARHGARAIRVPRDELWPALQVDRQHAGLKLGWAIAFGVLNRLALRRLPGYGLVAVPRVYGLMETGRMSEQYVVALLRGLDVAAAEFYFHPDTAPAGTPLGPNRGDLETLLSPAVSRIIEERGIRLTTFPEVA